MTDLKISIRVMFNVSTLLYNAKGATYHNRDLFHSLFRNFRHIFKKINVLIVDTLMFQCFVHSYCGIPSDIPFVIQRDVLALRTVRQLTR